MLASARPSRKLQAVAILLFAYKDRRKSSKVQLVSIARECLEDGAVAEEPAAHPIELLNETHRSLILGDPEECAQVCTELMARGSLCLNVKKYTSQMLRGLVQVLLDKGLLREEFREAAEEILERYPEISGA